MVIDSLGSGGAQRQLVELAGALVRNGYEVSIIAYHPGDFYIPDLEKIGVDAYIPHSPLSQTQKVFFVGKILRELKSELVVSMLKGPSILCCLVRFLSCFKFKLIVSERHFDHKVSLILMVRMIIFSLSNYIICNSASQIDTINRSKMSFRKMASIANSVDSHRFQQVKNFSNSNVNFVSVGNFTRNKNIKILIETVALNAVQLRARACNFRWFGDPENYRDIYDEACELVNNYSIGDIFELCPPSRQIEEVYREADGLILCSNSEAMPNVVLEAMSTGIIVIASDVGDVRRMLGDDYEYIFPVNSIKHLSTAILDITDTPIQERSFIGGRLRDRAMQFFSMDAFTQRWLSVISEVLAK